VAIEWPDTTSLPLDILGYILGSLAIVIAIPMTWRAARRWRRRLAPILTYFHLAGRLGLGWPERIWLLRLARRENLHHPLTLLVSESTLRHHVDRQRESLPRRAADRAERYADQVAHTLFRTG
jgi:hypothetical protein